MPNFDPAWKWPEQDVRSASLLFSEREEMKRRVEEEPYGKLEGDDDVSDTGCVAKAKLPEPLRARMESYTNAMHASQVDYTAMRVRYEQGLNYDERELLHRLFFCRECVPGPEVSLCSLPVCYRREWTAEAVNAVLAEKERAATMSGAVSASSSAPIATSSNSSSYTTGSGEFTLSASCPKKLKALAADPAPVFYQLLRTADHGVSKDLRAALGPARAAALRPFSLHWETLEHTCGVGAALKDAGAVGSAGRRSALIRLWGPRHASSPVKGAALACAAMEPRAVDPGFAPRALGGASAGLDNDKSGKVAAARDPPSPSRSPVQSPQGPPSERPLWQVGQ